MGLFIGSLVGAMAQIVPYAIVLLSGVTMALMAWRQEGGFDVILVMIGMLIGAWFGVMAAVIPIGVAIFVSIIVAVMLWRTQGVADGGPTSTLTMVLFIMVGVGFLWSGSYQDFCNPQNLPGFDACLNPGVSGYITAYQGCINDCTVTTFTFLGNSPFGYLLSGNFVGFIYSFYNPSLQTPFSFGSIFDVVSSLISFAVGAILLVLGSGIGVEAQAATIGGQISPDDSGTRLFQSMGIGLLIWGAVTFFLAGSTAWFNYIGFGLGEVGGFASAGAIYLMFITIYTYELYRQAKTYL